MQVREENAMQLYILHFQTRVRGQQLKVNIINCQGKKYESKNA